MLEDMRITLFVAPLNAARTAHRAIPTETNLELEKKKV
jgi:hypothetical protein